jgi:hypothetical protein
VNGFARGISPLAFDGIHLVVHFGAAAGGEDKHEKKKNRFRFKHPNSPRLQDVVAPVERDPQGMATAMQSREKLFDDRLEIPLESARASNSKSCVAFQIS